jgi:(S)-ureidoglycine aminohydrolase
MDNAHWPHLGHTRTRVRQNYTLLTPDTFVRAPLPGMTNGTAIVHASPALGAAFSQYTAELERAGTIGPALGERFIYVIEGEIALQYGGKPVRMTSGGYALLPEDCDHRIAARRKARLAVVEKPFIPVEGMPPPEIVIGREQDITPLPLMGDASIEVRPMIPANFAYDLAVSSMTYSPGASLPMVETHVMEHGLLMLDGGGIYRLGDDWLPTAAGDFIWMGPYCPQWFGALGKTPSRYLIYKDWNRHPSALPSL